LGNKALNINDAIAKIKSHCTVVVSRTNFHVLWDDSSGSCELCSHHLKNRLFWGFFGLLWIVCNFWL